MDFWFLIKCFLIGISASSTVGPIFILTFTRGALYGFGRGFASALGAALADGVFFSLGLLGALTLLENSKHFSLIINMLGGLILVLLGAISLRRYLKGTQLSYVSNTSSFATTAKTFVLTIFNPLVALFFMFISIQILPEGAPSPPIQDIIIGSLAVSGGSLLVLGSIAWLASHVGSAISTKRLAFLSLVTSILFMSVGSYLLGNSFITIFKQISGS
ncbi:MAG: LysE family transporter [bacterium]